MHSFPFIKAQALGNDFVILHNAIFREDVTFIKKLGDRRHGIGFDQLIVYDDKPTDDKPRGGRSAGDKYKVRFFNQDGSEAEACGNGTRCIGFYLSHLLGVESVMLHTKAGPIQTTLMDHTYPRATVKVAMQSPKLMTKTHDLEEDIRWLLDRETFINTFAVDVGNPHLVIFMSTLDRVNFHAIAPQLELHPFFKRGANISFITVKKSSESSSKNDNMLTTLNLRVWERGVGETPACGTAAFATSYAYHLLHPHCLDIRVEQEGGHLIFEKKSIASRKKMEQWFMVGEAHIVYEGVFYDR